MVFPRLQREFEVGADKGAAESGDEFLASIAFIASALATKFAVKPLRVARPVRALIGKHRVVDFRIAEGLERRHLDVVATDRVDRPSENLVKNIKPLKVARTDVDPFTLDEVRQLIEHVRPDYRNYLTVRFFTGMRTGETHGLKWKHIDFEHRQILVRESFVAGQQTTTKTDGSTREIQMSQPVFDALLSQSKVTCDIDYVFATSPPASEKGYRTHHHRDPIRRFLTHVEQSPWTINNQLARSPSKLLRL